ncbi:MAG TPA: DUF4097 family beta strand repeat-containing protein [Thermoanaerobaculia bacterium]|nr:DUF4097 family beta strand repeat-containing protein [Thermoanaerobaculia bacterium]
MKTSTKQISLLLAAAALLSSCAVGERHETTIERKWPASAIHNVKIGDGDGNVTVTAGDVNEISLVAQVSTRGIKPKPAEENQGYFRTTLSGDTLTIGRRGSHGFRVHFGFFNADDVTIDYTLHVPASVALSVTTVNGRIHASGIDGETRAVTVNGMVDLETTGLNEVVATAVNGEVRAKFLRDFRGAHLKTVNGRIEASLPSTASFVCDLSQVNGDFDSSFPLISRSSPGNRHISGEVNGGRNELRISTVNGSIRVENGGPVVPAAPAAPSAPPTMSNPPAAPAPPTPPAAPATPAPSPDKTL